MIPPRAPIVALRRVRIIIRFIDQRRDMFDSMNSGGIFCHVLKDNNITHLILDIIGGSHIWQGALPIFIRIENSKIHVDSMGNVDVIKVVIDKRNNPDLVD